MKTNLDMSWIQEYSRIHSIQQIMNREDLDTIEIQSIYMNANLEITKIDKGNIQLESIDNKKCISRETLLKLIQSKKINRASYELRSPGLDSSPSASRPGCDAGHASVNTTYKLFDILVYAVDLDPKDIQKYVNGHCNEVATLKSNLEKYSRCVGEDVNSGERSSSELDIMISPSLFIFHSLHTLFFFFVEMQNNTEYVAIKSILKTSENAKDGHNKRPKHTRKVHISESENKIICRKPLKKTRKIW